MQEGGNLCQIFVGNIVFLGVERGWGEGFFNGGLGGVGWGLVVELTEGWVKIYRVLGLGPSTGGRSCWVLMYVE